MWWSKAWGTQRCVALEWLLLAVAVGGVGLSIYGAKHPLRVRGEVDVLLTPWIVGLVLTAIVSLVQTQASQVRPQETLHIEK